MKKLNKSQRDFLDMRTKEENQQHLNASDAELEEIYGTPKHRHYPEHDWDLNGNILQKGK